DIAVTNDSLIEGLENIVVTLTGLSSSDPQVIVGAQDSASATITDNDTATISIAATNSVTEQGGAQNLVVTLTTSDGAGGTATLAPGVTLTADVIDLGTGTAGAMDYAALGTQSVTFGAGSGNGETRNVVLTTTNDTLVEGN